jgi:hypothetical protein
VIFLEVPLASIALILSIVSWKTFKSIRHLDVGKSFWIPMFASGGLFFVGSILAILDDLGLLSNAYSAEIVAGSRLLALCALLGCVYVYSRKITKNLAEKFLIQPIPERVELEREEEDSTSVIEKVDEANSKKEVDCKYEFGYLRTMPVDAPIPEECLGCQQIIECKHSIVKKVEDHLNPSS